MNFVCVIVLFVWKLWWKCVLNEKCVRFRWFVIVRKKWCVKVLFINWLKVKNCWCFELVVWVCCVVRYFGWFVGWCCIVMVNSYRVNYVGKGWWLVFLKVLKLKWLLMVGWFWLIGCKVMVWWWWLSMVKVIWVFMVIIRVYWWVLVCRFVWVS